MPRISARCLWCLLVVPLLIALGGCSLGQDYSKATGDEGPGYPVDTRMQSGEKPLNGLKTGGP